MGCTDKRLVIVEWLKRVHNDDNIATQKIFSASDLHEVYARTKNNNEPELKFMSFFCLLLSICRNKVYENLKEKITSRTKANNYVTKREFIIVADIIFCHAKHKKQLHTTDYQHSNITHAT